MTQTAPFELNKPRSAAHTRHRHPWVRLAINYAASLVIQYFFARSVSRTVLFRTDVVLYVASTLVIVVSMWVIFERAGVPRWAAIVPFYNVAMLYRLVGQPPRQSALLLIPVYNVYLFIRLMNDVSRAFGGDRVFTVILLISPFIGFPMLAFSKAGQR